MKLTGVHNNDKTKIRSQNYIDTTYNHRTDSGLEMPSVWDHFVI